MDFPTLDQLRARRTRKWTVHGNDVIPLFIAESDFPTLPAAKERLLELVEAEAFGYTPASSGLNQAVTGFYRDHYGYETSACDIVLVADVVRGLLLGIQHFTRPDSPVIVPTPAYPPFLQLPATAGRTMIDIPSDDGLRLEEVEKAFSEGAGSILLANPHNPTGVVHKEDFLRELCDLADRYDARVLVDEIHAPLVLEGHHTVAAGVSEAARRVCFTVTAASKAWNIAGLKCAQIILSNPNDLKIWAEDISHVAKDGVGTLGVYASTVCYGEGSNHLKHQIRILKENLAWLREALPHAIPGIEMTEPEATFLLWLDFRKSVLKDINKPASWLLKNAKVALNEGTDFGANGKGHARLNFATDRAILEEAVNRMARAVADSF